MGDEHASTSKQSLNIDNKRFPDERPTTSKRYKEDDERNDAGNGTSYSRSDITSGARSYSCTSNTSSSGRQISYPVAIPAKKRGTRASGRKKQQTRRLGKVNKRKRPVVKHQVVRRLKESLEAAQKRGEQVSPLQRSNTRLCSKKSCCSNCGHRYSRRK